MISDFGAFITALLRKGDFGIIMVLHQIYTEPEMILLSGWIYCREGVKAAVAIVSPSGFVWWDDADFCIHSYANLLLEHMYLSILEHMTVFKCDSS